MCSSPSGTLTITAYQTMMSAMVKAAKQAMVGDRVAMKMTTKARQVPETVPTIADLT